MVHRATPSGFRSKEKAVEFSRVQWLPSMEMIATSPCRSRRKPKTPDISIRTDPSPYSGRVALPSQFEAYPAMARKRAASSAISRKSSGAKTACALSLTVRELGCLLRCITAPTQRLLPLCSTPPLCIVVPPGTFRPNVATSGSPSSLHCARSNTARVAFADLCPVGQQGYEDMTDMKVLNDAEVLANLRTRYNQKKSYVSGTTAPPRSGSFNCNSVRTAAGCG
jgi:hypothetical protein